MDEQMKRVAIVALILIAIFSGIAIAYVLKVYNMSAATQQRNLRLYRDAAATQVIPLTYAWTDLISEGTSLNLWARNDGNIAGNFTLSVVNTINATVSISVDTFMNLTPGEIRPTSLLFTNVTADATGVSWQIIVNTNPP